MKPVTLLLSLLLLIFFDAQAAQTDPKGSSIFCPERVNNSGSADNRCLVSSVVTATAVYNLASRGINYGKEDYEGPKYSSIKSAYEGICVGRIADSTWQKLNSLAAMNEIARKKATSDPNGFVKSAWKQYKDRVASKKWESDLLPKLAGTGYKKITAGTPLEMGAGIVEHAAKERLENKYPEGKTTTKNAEDFAKLSTDLLCENAVQKLIEESAFSKPGMFTSILKSANSINDITGIVENKLFYADIATKLALDGGGKGKEFYIETITPLIAGSKAWSNTQKIKASQIKDRFKDLLFHNKGNAEKYIDNGLDATANAKNIAIQSSVKLTNSALLARKNFVDRISATNKTFFTLETKLTQIIKDGEHFPIESEMRKYTEFMRLHLEKLRIENTIKTDALKEKIAYIDSGSIPDEVKKTGKIEKVKAKIEKVKVKMKSFYGKIKGKFKNKEI